MPWQYEFLDGKNLELVDGSLAGEFAEAGHHECEAHWQRIFPDSGVGLLYDPDVRLMRSRRVLAKASNVVKLIGPTTTKDILPEMLPFIDEAQAWLNQAMEQIAQKTGGYCGAIETAALRASAWQMAYANFWMARALRVGGVTDPSKVQIPANVANLPSLEERPAVLVQTGSRLLDSSRQNSLAALDTAVRISRLPQVRRDPLARYLEEQEQEGDSDEFFNVEGSDVPGQLHEGERHDGGLRASSGPEPERAADQDDRDHEGSRER